MHDYASLADIEFLLDALAQSMERFGGRSAEFDAIAEAYLAERIRLWKRDNVAR